MTNVAQASPRFSRFNGTSSAQTSRPGRSTFAAGRGGARRPSRIVSASRRANAAHSLFVGRSVSTLVQVMRHTRKVTETVDSTTRDPIYPDALLSVLVARDLPRLGEADWAVLEARHDSPASMADHAARIPCPSRRPPHSLRTSASSWMSATSALTPVRQTTACRCGGRSQRRHHPFPDADAHRQQHRRHPLRPRLQLRHHVLPDDRRPPGPDRLPRSRVSAARIGAREPPEQVACYAQRVPGPRQVQCPQTLV